MSSLGRVQRCDGRVAFRVDLNPMPPGTKLSRYYMHVYARLIDEMQPSIEAGSTAFAQHLTAEEWRYLDLANKTVGLESDLIKMMIVLEAIFEHARRRFASHLPSRLDCVFVWSTLELAKKFRQQYHPDGIIQHCALQGEAIELDGSLLPPGINLSDLSAEAWSIELQNTRLRAEKYWKAHEAADFSELLVTGDVTVLRIETEG